MIEFGRLSWYKPAVGKSSQELDFSSPAVIETLTQLTIAAQVSKYSIPLAEVARPDRTSIALYQSPNYFWVLMQVNGITDPFQEWLAGRIIIYPALGDIASALNLLGPKMKNEDSIRVYLDSAEDDMGRTKPIRG